MKVRSRSKKVLDKTDVYDLAVTDPFAFLSNLRSSSELVDSFDPESMNKSAHSLIDTSFIEQEIDIARTIREVVDSKILVPRDTKIDDSGIPVAKNVYEWCTNDRFSMINGERPYIEQLVWGIVAYNEHCPNCSDVEYLYFDHAPSDSYNKFERKVALLEHGVCPHCGWGRSKLVKKGRMNFIQELAVCAGQRSGKSLSIAGYFAPYLTHRLLKLQNPNAFYGLKTGTMLHCTFVALTYAQAKDTLWQNYYATLTESSWFSEYHGMLRFYEEKYGDKLLKLNDTYVAYPSRGLMAYPAGPDKRVLRGRTRYFTAVDEVGYFDANRDTKKVKDNAHEVVGALDRSLLTVRGAAETLLRLGYDDVYPGYAMNVSSPSHRNDMIMTLVRRAEHSKTMYGIIRPTWEVNPTLPRDGNTISEAYRIDPINAERDYGAVPPLAANPFLTKHSEIEETIGTKKNSVRIKKKYTESKKRGESYTWATIAKKKTTGKASIMALDAGLTNNSFAGVVARPVGNDYKIDCAFEVIPVRGAPLNHSLIFEEVLIPIMEARNVKVLLADRWNSVKLLQDAQLRIDGLHIEQISLKYKDMFCIKTLLETGPLGNGRLILPQIERDSFQECVEFDDENYPNCFENQPVSHLVMQMATVKDTGRMVDKADGYTDDLYRAMTLAVHGMQQEEILGILLEAPEIITASRPSAIAASRNYSGGGNAIGSSSRGGTSLIGAVMPGRK